uniref:Fibronectin type-III domain-containing protein n=1 Tax=Eptatretus burgeri TaxID=7764 RepID=A0A8C4R4A3_EPTBU
MPCDMQCIYSVALQDWKGSIVWEVVIVTERILESREMALSAALIPASNSTLLDPGSFTDAVSTRAAVDRAALPLKGAAPRSITSLQRSVMMGFQPLIAALLCIFARLCQGEDHVQIACRSRFYPHNVTCHWTLDEEYRPASEVHAVYRFKTTQKICPKSKRSAHSCTISNLALFSKARYTVIVDVSTPLGNISGKTMFKVEEIVQPDPPSHVEVEQVPGCDTCVHVHWKKPASYTAGDRVQFQYFLQYRQQHHHEGSWSEIPQRKQRANITDARPGAVLNVRLAAKVIRKGKKSPWSKSVAITPWLERIRTTVSPSETTFSCISRHLKLTTQEQAMTDASTDGGHGSGADSPCAVRISDLNEVLR